MRLLATQHLYREITPDVFANTRLSGAMSTGKTIEEIVAEYVSITFVSLDLTMQYKVPRPNMMELLDTWLWRNICTCYRVT